MREWISGWNAARRAMGLYLNDRISDIQCRDVKSDHQKKTRDKDFVSLLEKSLTCMPVRQGKGRVCQNDKIRYFFNVPMVTKRSDWAEADKCGLCPEGFFRHGDGKCVKPSECRDCVFDAFGDPQYIFFHHNNFMFGGNQLHLRGCPRNTFKVWIENQSRFSGLALRHIWILFFGVR